MPTQTRDWHWAFQIQLCEPHIHTRTKRGWRPMFLCKLTVTYYWSFVNHRSLVYSPHKRTILLNFALLFSLLLAWTSCCIESRVAGDLNLSPLTVMFQGIFLISFIVQYFLLKSAWSEYGCFTSRIRSKNNAIVTYFSEFSLSKNSQRLLYF